jgi:methyltransferase of ATP-grasp peptide maturase system
MLGDPRWQAAFGQVPRHVFLPRFFRQQPGGRWAALDSTDADWLPLVYEDTVLVTQLDDDSTLWHTARQAGPVTGVPTSSSSQPAIMAVMLAELAVQDGQRVLEIGTGTGYNAALLCHRLGADAVTTVDIDPTLVAAARENLATAGFFPTVALADGAGGLAAHAPYDRVMATCSVSTVPPEWLAQTRPGGIVLTTLNRPIGAGLVRLTAGRDATAVGRVLPEDGRFMPLRAHRRVNPHPSPRSSEGETRTTKLDPGVLLSAASPFEFFAGLALPGVYAHIGGAAGAQLTHPDGSWARFVSRSGKPIEVTQGGPRRLWDLAEQAHEQWRALDRPRRQRFGITVRGEHQELWLDEEDSPHRWRL